MFYIIMGVSGSGKSTVGKLLSDRLNCNFFDADDFHPQANIYKMNQGTALNDQDRAPWLEKLRQLIGQTLAENRQGVLACSALKQKYRQILRDNNSEVIFVYLQGSYDCIQARIKERKGHFMSAELLQSQFETLEEPDDALIIDISLPPQAIVQEIMSKMTKKAGDIDPQL